MIREFVQTVDDREWQSSLFSLLQSQTYNQCEVDLFELMCKVLDQNLFSQVDWARNTIFFKDLKVGERRPSVLQSLSLNGSKLSEAARLHNLRRFSDDMRDFTPNATSFPHLTCITFDVKCLICWFVQIWPIPKHFHSDSFRHPTKLTHTPTAAEQNWTNTTQKIHFIFVWRDTLDWPTCQVELNRKHQQKAIYERIFFNRCLFIILLSHELIVKISRENVVWILRWSLGLFIKRWIFYAPQYMHETLHKKWQICVMTQIFWIES